jgi:hypothetical protein
MEYQNALIFVVGDAGVRYRNQQSPLALTYSLATFSAFCSPCPTLRRQFDHAFDVRKASHRLSAMFMVNAGLSSLHRRRPLLPKYSGNAAAQDSDLKKLRSEGWLQPI